MQQKIKQNKQYIIILLLVLLIISITCGVVTNKELFIDNLAYKILVEKLRCPLLTKIMKIITSLSNTGVIILIATFITLALYQKNKKVALTIPTNLALVAILNQILKFLFHRPRPTGYRLLEIGGYSFPSGHAMASMAFYGFLIYLAHKFIKNNTIKKLIIILNILIIILIGISRIYLGVHYCSDVLVGYSISIIYLMLYIKVLKKQKIIK